MLVSEKAAHSRSACLQSLVDFKVVNYTALSFLSELLIRWLPDGKRSGQEWIAKNPKRVDHKSGSFKINMITGRWADFATGDKGGDVVSLAAYLSGTKQIEAAKKLAVMLGVPRG